MTESATIGSLETAFTVIETVVERKGAGVTELSKELDLPPSTIHDHLVTLTDLGYLVKTSESTYEASTQFLSIASAARNKFGIFEFAKPEIRSLADKTGEHVSLVVAERNIGVLLYTVKGEKAVQFKTPLGMEIYLHGAAPGKAILAFLSEEKINEVINRWGLPAMTENTITDRGELEDELETIRENKFALDDGEGMVGLRSVASPILGENDEVLGAISVYGPSKRVDDSHFRETLPKMLLETTNIVEVNTKLS